MSNIDEEVIICPACKKEMEKVYLPNQKITIDVCTKGCGGIYLDNREYRKIDENAENIEPVLEALKGKKFQKTDGEEIRVCPVCGTRMVKNYTSHLKTVQIDECYNCGGKFLDAGELTKIRGEFNTEDERIEAFNAYAKELLGDTITPSNKKDKATPFAKIMKRIADRFI